MSHNKNKKYYLIPEIKYTSADVYNNPDIDLLVSHYSFLDMRDINVHPFSNNNLTLIFTSRERNGLTMFKNRRISKSDDKHLVISGDLVMNKIELIDQIDNTSYYKTVVIKASVEVCFMKMDFAYIKVADMGVGLNISDDQGLCSLNDPNIAFLTSTYAVNMEQEDPDIYKNMVADFMDTACIMQYDPIDKQSIHMPSKEQFVSYSMYNKNYYVDYVHNLEDMQKEIKRLKDKM